jgi:hypothetical protein
VRWFRRGEDAEPAPVHVRTGPVADRDDPGVLRDALSELNRFINRSSCRLPAAAVVRARWITDTLRDIIDTSVFRPLEIHAVLLIQGTLHDYLPTTLRSYLAVDTDMREVPRVSGRTPTESLLEQLDALQTSASATLVAARNQDADALMTQGNFLRTKFSGSDLDL